MSDNTGTITATIEFPVDAIEEFECAAILRGDIDVLMEILMRGDPVVTADLTRMFSFQEDDIRMTGASVAAGQYGIGWMRVKLTVDVDVSDDELLDPIWFER